MQLIDYRRGAIQLRMANAVRGLAVLQSHLHPKLLDDQD